MNTKQLEYDYTLTAPHAIDFTKPVNSQVNQISVSANKKIKQAQREGRENPLKHAATGTATGRVKFTIRVESSFDTNLFSNASKSLSFRFVKNVKVSKIDGQNSKELSEDIAEALQPLNTFLAKDVNKKSKQWQKDLDAELKSLTASMKKAGRFDEEVKTNTKQIIRAAKKHMEWNAMSYRQRFSHYVPFSVICGSFALMVQIGAFMGSTFPYHHKGVLTAAFLHYVNNASLEEMLPSLLSGEGLSESQLNSYVAQISEASRQMPDQFSAEALLTSSINRWVWLSTFVGIFFFAVTCLNLFNTCRNAQR